MSNNVLDWNEVFTAIAQYLTMRSNLGDLSDGTCIVDNNYRMISLGYSGLPRGFNLDDGCGQDIINTYAVTSVSNAIYLFDQSLANTRLYTLNFPSSDDIKSIIQKGIRFVNYVNNPVDLDDYKASCKMIDRREDNELIYVEQLPKIKVSTNRNVRINWNDLFLGLAKILSMRSKDPNTQVGACIVDSNNRILSLGYNGRPRGTRDSDFTWNRVGDKPSDTKYPYIVHAEHNAISISNGKDLRGSSIYVTLFPCLDCAKKIIQSGIKHVYYSSDKYANEQGTINSKYLLSETGVTFDEIPDIEIEVKAPTKTLKR